MVKLAISDIDGTLGPDGTSCLPPRLLKLIPELKKNGILFAAASGRQFHSLRNLFREVEQDVIFIAENGAYVVCRDTEMSVSPMERHIVEELTLDLRKFESVGGYLTASTPSTIYVENDDPTFLNFLINGYKADTKVVSDVLSLNQPIIKMSLYRGDGVAEYAYNELMPRWKERIKAEIAGTMWLDFMDLSVDKGNAVARIQELTGISKEETICFGDNANDCSMFAKAKTAYAVENALPETKEAADCVIDSYKKDGVIRVLESLCK